MDFENVADVKPNALLDPNISVEDCTRLIQAGVSVNVADHIGMTPLHFARNAEICELLIKNGADINAGNQYEVTPLYQASAEHRLDVLHALLYYGADAKISNKFGNIALMNVEPDSELAQIVFDLTYDQIEEEIYWKTLSVVQTTFAPCMFRKMVAACSNIAFYVDSELHFYAFLVELLYFSPDNLRLFVGKFQQFVLTTMGLVNAKIDRSCNFFGLPKDLQRFEANLQILEEHNLLVSFIELFPYRFEYYCHKWMTEPGIPLRVATRIILVFVSNGLVLSRNILDTIYSTHNFCELFRILIHCEQSNVDFNYEINQNARLRLGTFVMNVMARLIYDINLSLERLLQEPAVFIGENSALDLLDHFAHPQLMQYCRAKYVGNDEIQTQLKRMPETPKLVELARNAARVHIIKQFGIKTASQLYTYIDHLYINCIYKDILTYKKRLYI